MTKRVERPHHRPFIINGVAHADLYAPQWYVMCGDCATQDHPNALELRGPLSEYDAAAETRRIHATLFR